MSLGEELSFVLGDWTDANGDEVEAADPKVYVSDREVEAEIVSGRFTLPAETFEEEGGYTVYVTAAPAEGRRLRSETIFLNVGNESEEREGGAASMAEAEDSDSGAGSSGCDAGLAGVAALALLPALVRRKKN